MGFLIKLPRRSKIKTPSLKQLLGSPALLIAFGFGSGLSPKAPGTMGSLVAIPFLPLMAYLSIPVAILVILLVLFLGMIASHKACTVLNYHDHPGIVIDEIVGMFITFLLIPISLTNVLVGFLLFRIFDIFKPWPIGFLDKKLKGGLGVMMDDVAAGVLANLVLQGFIYLYFK